MYTHMHEGTYLSTESLYNEGCRVIHNMYFLNLFAATKKNVNVLILCILMYTYFFIKM